MEVIGIPIFYWMQHYIKGIVDLGIYVLLISSKNMVNFPGFSLEATSVPVSYWMAHYIEDMVDLSIYVLLISGVAWFLFIFSRKIFGPFFICPEKAG